MLTAFAQIKENIITSAPLINKYRDINEVKKELFDIIDNDTLQIMLYGAYNAGKSTLINVLLGEELAVVNDIPTTDKVDEFNWCGYKLLDTPGVNAPIEHEKTTNEQIKRSSVMLFVIREGDQDSKDLYIRLFEMLALGKKVFIVLNHQLTNDDDKAMAYKKIHSIVMSQAPKYGIEDKQIRELVVCPINLKTALNGRLNQHDKLLDHSGYTNFISLFEQWVKMNDAEQERLEHAISAVNTLWYMPTITELKQDGTDESNDALLNFRQDLAHLQARKKGLILESREMISHNVRLMKAQISQTLTQSTNQIELDTELEALISPLYKKVELWLEESLSHHYSTLSCDVQHTLKQASEDKNNPFFDSMLNQAKTFFSDEKTIKQGLLYGRKFKIPGLKGRWEKTLGQWAGRAAIVIQVVSVFWDAYKANEQQEKENERQRMQAVELYQAVDQISQSIISGLSSSVEEIINDILSIQISVIENEINKIDEELDNKIGDLSQLSNLQNTLLSIHF
ncbi:hypothetical protein GNP82_09300 [Aliivibrio fischeri]|uniref:G domain-containing protein n=1 Tax=Aliivibrio fischeri TaxID=668 RepID=A0A6N3YZJ4_ALIFS|nr:GTPase [Aliivibrio fischeri]MUK37747.1 hypothetical protein [Aliivibrio fischeri]MUK45127.1 hypothetical protein [Aliivibrio fischeri]MUK80786.1 hypothetical protein [Aliivibrio fischeri]MUK84205.1 hypothetical protein [Aliivibrio fischeri]MUL06533.1 hypothetical protein [Aliivibrio fischeri]